MRTGAATLRIVVVAVVFLALGLFLPPYAGAVVNWTKDTAHNPVLDKGTSGAWDEREVVRPVVIKDGPTDYRMWYTGSNSGATTYIGYATSTDGVTWAKYLSGTTPVLCPSGTSGYYMDSGSVGHATVHKEGSTYVMYYSGTSEYNTTDEVNGWQIFRATSTDGYTWTRSSAFPVLYKGWTTDWDSDGVGAPVVIYDSTANPAYRMWYYGWSGTWNYKGIGYATSIDGINWTKHNNPGTNAASGNTWFQNSDPVLLGLWWGGSGPNAWDSGGIEPVWVIKEGAVYRMWYPGQKIANNSSTRIGYAWSMDGKNWIKYDGNPVIFDTGSGSGAFDEDGAFDPCVVKDGTTYKMWYAGSKGCSGGGCTDSIGYATSPAYPTGAHLQINQAQVANRNNSSGVTMMFTVVPEGPSPQDISELKVTWPGGGVSQFNQTHVQNIMESQIVSMGAHYPGGYTPPTGTYTFSVTANNGETATKELSLTPVTIPYPHDGGADGFLSRYIEVSGVSTYGGMKDYISATTPTFRWKPCVGDSYYYRVRVQDWRKQAFWYISDPVLGSTKDGDGYLSTTVPEGVLIANAPYRWEVEVLNNADPWTAHSRSASDLYAFYTGTKDTSSPYDFLPSPGPGVPGSNVVWNHNLANGDQAFVYSQVIGLAPWDFGWFWASRSGVTAYWFNPEQNALTSSAIPFLYSLTMMGRPVDDPNYTFSISDKSGHEDGLNDTLATTGVTPPLVDRRDSISPADNSYLSNTQPTFTWKSKGTEWQYRVAITDWNNRRIVYQGNWINGVAQGQDMTQTLSAGILQEHSPYRWGVEVRDVGWNARTQSNLLGFMTGSQLGVLGNDFNADGKADILWRNSTSGQLIIWLMNGTVKTSYASPGTVPESAWQIIDKADFDGDGKVDILWRHSTTGQVIIWLMNGTVKTSYASPGTVPEAAWQIQNVGDFNGDGKADILWRHSTTGQLIIWLMNGTVKASYASPGTVPEAAWQIQNVGDFNGDGKADILWRHSTTGQLIIWLMNGTVKASYASPGTVPEAAWQIKDVGDFNGDGMADILWRHSTTGQLIIWLMNGTVKTSYASPGTVPEAAWQIQNVGDFNGDGKADILWRHSTTGQLIIWLMNGTVKASYASPGTVSESAWQIK